MATTTPTSNSNRAAERQAQIQRERAAEARRAAKRSQEAAEKHNTPKNQQQAVQTANRALKAEQRANAADRAAGNKVKYQAADGQRDAYDAASLSARDQKQLFGAKVSSVSPAQAARSDAQRVSEATRRSPAEGARVLREQLSQEGVSPAYQKALARASAGSVAEIAKSLNDDTPEADVDAIVADLSRASELSGKAGAQAIAKTFGNNVDWEGLPSTFADSIQKAVEGGAGTRFGVELARVADASDARIHVAPGVGARFPGNPEISAADAINVSVRDGVKSVREDYDEVKKEADQLDAKLGKLVAGYGPGMTPEQRQDAIKAFRERHDDVYGKLEDLGGKLGSTLAGMADVKKNGSSYHGLQDEANSTLHDLPNLARSQGGRAAIAQGIEAKQRGEDSFLDVVGDVAQDYGGDKKFLDGVAHALTDATAEKVLQLTADGDAAGARRLIDTVSQSSVFSAEDRAALKKTGAHLDGLFSKDPAVRAKALGSLETDLEGKDGKKGLFEDHNGTAANFVKTIGLVAGVASSAKGIENFDELDFKSQVKTVADTLGVGAEAGVTAIDVLGRGDSALAKTLGKVATPVAVVGLVVDGLGAVESFKEGHLATGGAQTAQVLGSALLTAAVATEVVPVAGQIAGAVLLAGGLIAQAIIADEALDDDRDDAQAFLEAAGFSPEQAEAFTNLEGDDRYNPGWFFQEVAKDQNVSAKDLFDWMKTLSPDEAKAFALAGKRDYTDTTAESRVDYLEKYGLVPGGSPDPEVVKKINDEGELYDNNGDPWPYRTLWAGPSRPTTPSNVA